MESATVNSCNTGLKTTETVFTKHFHGIHKLFILIFYSANYQMKPTSDAKTTNFLYFIMLTCRSASRRAANSFP